MRNKVVSISIIILSIIGLICSIVNYFLGTPVQEDFLLNAFLWIIILMDNIKLLINRMEDEWWKKIL